MFTRLLVTGLLLWCTLGCMAQAVLSGVVTDKETGKPLPGASVFISNTSSGTVTRSDGRFSLPPLTPGKCDLVIAALGYETYITSITVSTSIALPGIALQPKVNELKEVVVASYEKDGWKKWGRYFLDNFIGTADHAADCTIKNYKVIHFRHSKKNNTLQAFASEPLVIENKWLGYTIKYQLEEFTSNFSTRYLLFVGYPLFEQMQGRKGQVKRWTERREESYYGSIMHFMRSVYRNKLAEEHFLVYHVKKLPATREQPARDVLYSTPLPGDSIAYAVDSSTAGMRFNDYLQVVYTQREEPADYRRQIFAGYKKGYITSQITLLRDSALEIFSNGSFYNPVDMVSSGFWGWSEKISDMLPFDYKPGSLQIPR